ncbi:hypothetical protein [Nocardia sp. alder85J]|uniref:hypothetical protein n=1 Tax=Nocardia sp. alder85J TaxID=2862949 RepID=UPI001CD7DB6E|nr:hypothetical protein [Nocardia sp. alder85J]MCX4092901.1 hypothetical protein [Nocardia sp. alder85J]
MGGERPAGVLSRVRQAQSTEQARRNAEPRWALRRSLTDLYTACGFYTVLEVPASKVTSLAREAVTLLDDASQLRTGSAYEELCLRCAREYVTGYVSDPQTDFDAEHAATLRVMTQVMTEFGWAPDNEHAGLGLVCEQQAMSVLEDLQRPYLAASAIRAFRLYEPDDPFGICTPMHVWCTRWEDEPDNRATIDADITTALRRFLARHVSRRY